MAGVFAIVTEDDSVPLDISGVIKRLYPDHFRYNKRTWFVSGEGLTVKKIAHSLGITDDEDENEVEGVAVFRITASYWGNANADLWEWLKANFERGHG